MAVKFFNTNSGPSNNGGGSISVGQVTKLDVIAPHETTIAIPFTSKFDKLPVEVLKVHGKQTGVTQTLCNFDNSDSTDFEINEFVEFDGAMRLKTEYGPFEAATYGTSADIFLVDIDTALGDKTLKEILVG